MALLSATPQFGCGWIMLQFILWLVKVAAKYSAAWRQLSLGEALMLLEFDRRQSVDRLMSYLYLRDVLPFNKHGGP